MSQELQPIPGAKAIKYLGIVLMVFGFFSLLGRLAKPYAIPKPPPPPIDARAQAGFNRAEMLFRVSKYDQSCEEFEQAVKISPAAPIATHLQYLYANAYLQRGEATGTSAERFLNAFGWKAADGNLNYSIYAALLGYTGYQQAGNEHAAKQLVDEGVAKCDTTRWPYAILVYLHGEMDFSSLLSLVGNDNGRATEAFTFAGVRLLYGGDKEKAISAFSRVAENGRKEFWEYPLAISELRRALQTGANVKQDQSPLPTESDKAEAEAHFNRAELFFKTSEFDKVCDEFENAMILDPVAPYSTYCKYVCASVYARRGEVAGKAAERFLGAFGWKNEFSTHAVLLGYVGYRQTGNMTDAKRLLDDGAVKCNTTQWPYPIVTYLRSEMNQSALLSLVKNDRGAMMDGYTFIGIQEFYGGGQADALANLELVEKNGPRDRWTYQLAIAELQHATQSAPSR